VRRFRLGRVALVILAIAGVAGLGVGLAASQAQDRKNDQSLFQIRTVIAARFVSTYTAQLLAREHSAAAAELASSPPSQLLFAAVNASFGFGAVVLLDARGDVMAVAPSSPALIGTNLSRRYAHLAAAVAGRQAVSNLARSAALGLPVVAFATPFLTPSGLRVYSGAFEVADTPLDVYLANAITYPGHRAYLIDAKGNIVSSNPSASEESIRSLAVVDPALSAAIASVPNGALSTQHAYYAVRAVTGTPWRVVATVPDVILYSPQSGASVWVPWLLFVALSVGTIAGLIFLFRYLDGRERLNRLNVELGRVARIDSLTNLHNRRHLEEQLSALLSAARRERRPLGLLLVDLDNFKRVNDLAGHAAGDRALQETARRLRNVVRAEDVLGRWGGEEFLVIVPGGDVGAATTLAERLRSAMELTAVDLGGVSLDLTLSIGVAAGLDADAEDLIRGADAAMYRAKQEGRNRVISAPHIIARATALSSGSNHSREGGSSQP
jgi:diguanylate cyclase (GGDEF)-like protein